MEMKEFENLKEVKDEIYPHINKYQLDDDVFFFVEPSFHTQLNYVKDHFLDRYPEIINEILDTARRNKKVIFTGNYEEPAVHYDDYIYREIDDVLAALKLSFDSKGNPDSDWKD